MFKIRPLLGAPGNRNQVPDQGGGAFPENAGGNPVLANFDQARTKGGGFSPPEGFRPVDARQFQRPGIAGDHMAAAPAYHQRGPA